MRRKLDKRDLVKMQGIIGTLRRIPAQIGNLTLQQLALATRQDQALMAKRAFFAEVEEEYGLKGVDYEVDYITGQITRKKR